MSTYTAAGVTLLRQEDGSYRTEDGRYELREDYDFETECEEAHPVKLTAGLIKNIQERPHLYPHEADWAVQHRKKGYLCPGGCMHFYGGWVVWDLERNDWKSGPTPYPSLKEAVRQELVG